MRVAHLDTDFLVYALTKTGPERSRLTALARSNTPIQMSAVAWYEFTRGPRTNEQLAVGRGLLHENGVVPFSEELASLAGQAFRHLGSPRRRGNDIAIGITALASEAILLTRNAADFRGIEGLVIESTGT